MDVPSYDRARASESYANRINTVLARSLDHSLAVVQSPPGYGKSSLIEGFLRTENHPYAILALRETDNWEYFFWTHLLEQLVKVFPDPETCYSSGDFPYNSEQIRSFLARFHASARAEARSVFVIDNYELLTNDRIASFIKNLIECEIENLTFIVIGNQESPPLEALAHSVVSAVRIGEDELRLTGTEVRELFASYGIKLAEIQASSLAAQWEGWPLAIWTTLDDSRREGWDAAQSKDGVRQFFARAFFNAYPSHSRKTLVQLSLAECFTEDMVRELCSEPARFMALVRQIPFTCFDPQEQTYSFRKTYRLFLASKKGMLDEADRFAASRAAANMFTAIRRPLHALPHLVACKEYDDVADILSESLDVYAKRSKVRYLLHIVEQLPSPYCSDHPKIEFFRIVFLLLLGQTDETERGLHDLFARFDAGKIEDSALLGELHFLSAHVSHLRGREDFVEHYRAASECLPSGSRYWSDYPPVILNAGLLVSANSEPGALARTEKLIDQSHPYLKILLRGKGSRIGLLYAATSRFYTYRLDEAYGYAQEIMLDAKLNCQHELLLTAYYLIVRIAMLRGAVAEARETLDAAAAHINRYDLVQLRGFYDRMAALFSLYASVDETAPVWLSGEPREGALWEYSREACVHACYLLETNDNRKAVALVNQVLARGGSLGDWTDTVYLYLYRAIARCRLGESEGALDDLSRAYEMTFPNDIVTPFIECAGGMRSLLTLARKQRPQAYDSAWVSTVYAKASSYAKKIAGLRSKTGSSQQRLPQLSPRKIEVLQALADGLTQKEIAQQLGVAPSTVKTHITSIYEALGAQSKVDAVRIALMGGIIE